MNYKISELETIAKKIRGKVIEMSYKSRASHLGSSLSCVDILVAIYWAVLTIDPSNPSDPDRDRFILSKGHAASAIYTTLAFRGFFSHAILDSYATAGSCLEEHPGPIYVPGIEAATGSLGHGLSIGIGMALSSRIQKQSYKTFVLLGDGECNEGSVWEAAMFASAHSLKNLIAIIDFNKWQATGRSCEIMALQPFKEKWKSFGWNSYEIDGHDMNTLVNKLRDISYKNDKPTAVVAHTIKGKGVSFMEDDNNWHYRIPTQEEVIMSKKELGLI